MGTDPHASHLARRSALVDGVARFNDGRFWLAHEAWETLWLAEPAGPEKEYLRGLIQLAAAYHHVQRGTVRGAVRLFDAALRRLETAPAGWRGIDRAAAISSAARHRERAARGERIEPDELPKLRYN